MAEDMNSGHFSCQCNIGKLLLFEVVLVMFESRL